MIWCDTEDISGKCNGYAFTFCDDQQNCINYIKSISKTEVIFLITTIPHAMEILPEINNLRQLNSVFMYLSIHPVTVLQLIRLNPVKNFTVNYF